MMLPIIIRSADVVLRLVPGNLREASAALGAPQWRTVWHVVLPTARSGLTTAVILGVARGIGETSPVLLTAGFTATMNINPLNGPMVSLPLAAFELVRSPQPTHDRPRLRHRRGADGARARAVHRSPASSAAGPPGACRSARRKRADGTLAAATCGASQPDTATGAVMNRHRSRVAAPAPRCSSRARASLVAVRGRWCRRPPAAATRPTATSASPARARRGRRTRSTRCASTCSSSASRSTTTRPARRAGRKNFLNGTVDFAASDIPFQFHPEDGSAPENPAAGSYAYMPIVAGGTSFMYNLKINGKRVTNLRLSGENVAKIFTGAITHVERPGDPGRQPRARRCRPARSCRSSAPTARARPPSSRCG